MQDSNNSWVRQKGSANAPVNAERKTLPGAGCLVSASPCWAWVA